MYYFRLINDKNNLIISSYLIFLQDDFSQNILQRYIT